MKKTIFLISAIMILCILGHAQKTESDDLLKGVSLKAFEYRNIGPALKSGRISDIAVHPENQNIWYVTVGSGGVWKTENSGITWAPIFDNQKVFYHFLVLSFLFLFLVYYYII